MMDLTRRRFLGTSLALAAGVASSGLGTLADAAPAAVPVPKSLDTTPPLLKEIIGTYARLEDDPWSLMHLVRALGRSVTIKGKDAVEFLCSRFLKERTVAGKTLLYMPVKDEGHSNAFLKTLLEAGVPPARRFQLDGKRYTVGDLVNSARALFTFDPKTINRDDLAWSLIAFSLQVPPDSDTWVNALGQQIRFSEVVRLGFDTLDESTREFRAAKARGVMPDKNDRIANFACGGTHLIYGLASCVGNGHHGDDFRRRLRDHLDLLVWRLDADGHLMERFYSSVPPPEGKPPGWERVYALYRNDARIKFYGHAFEILSYVKQRGVFSPSPAQVSAIERAGAALAAAVGGIKGVDLFEIRKTSQRLFQLLVGDCCHAYHGIRMVPGVNQV